MRSHPELYEDCWEESYFFGSGAAGTLPKFRQTKLIGL